MFYCVITLYVVLFFKQKTAYEMRISDWSSDVCSSDLRIAITSWQAAHCQEAPLTTCMRRLHPGRVSAGFASCSTLRGQRLPRAWPDAMCSWSNPSSEERRVGKACVSTCRSLC